MHLNAFSPEDLLNRADELKITDIEQWYLSELLEQNSKECILFKEEAFSQLVKLGIKYEIDPAMFWEKFYNFLNESTTQPRVVAVSFVIEFENYMLD
ncbi:hypothetical protein A3Q56_03754 [Intoshia linei]|uniref:Uncharacterized protein n=1 Tax=Intoshia linei TaxID=1819745 RepID=A0A177B548_9BILA|nr:hypothetical protein A3Q56_03754 [Intoshia linei]